MSISARIELVKKQNDEFIAKQVGYLYSESNLNTFDKSKQNFQD